PLFDLGPDRPVAVSAVAELVHGGRRVAADALVEHAGETARQGLWLRRLGLFRLPGWGRRLFGLFRQCSEDGGSFLLARLRADVDFHDLQTKVRSRSGRSQVHVRLRIGVMAALLALLPVGSAAASAHRAGSWALPEIRVVTSAGLMGTKSPATFHPDAKLTNQALANLVFDLQRILAPPAPVAPVAPVAPPVVPTTTDPTQTTTGTTTATTGTDPTATVPVTTTAPAPVPPAHAPKVEHGATAATMTMLDAQLVDGVGLDAAASEFAQGARAAGLAVPDRFGNEVVARLLGLRIDHPAAQDYLELLPDDPATRAEAAYSAAQLMHSSGWLVPIVQAAADTFSLPQSSTWQRRIIDTAVARIGMPYVWGGTSDGH